VKENKKETAKFVFLWCTQSPFFSFALRGGAEVAFECHVSSIKKQMQKRKIH